METDETDHASYRRLYAAVATRGHTTKAAIARALNTTDQAVGNWPSRGVSQDGALNAQRAVGVSATWILDGEGPRWLAGFEPPGEQLQARPRVTEAPAPYAPTLPEALQHLAEHLREAKPDARFSAAPLLARLAESPETSARVIRALEALLNHTLIEA